MVHDHGMAWQLYLDPNAFEEANGLSLCGHIYTISQLIPLYKNEDH